MAGREDLREPSKGETGPPARTRGERENERENKRDHRGGIGRTGLQELVDRTVRYRIGHVMRKYKALQK